MRLSDKQKEIIKLMRKDWVAENSMVNNESAYLIKYGYSTRRKYYLSNFKTLMGLRLIKVGRVNFALERYTLTELGNSIEL